MSNVNSDLRFAYENLLKDHGLDRLSQTEESLEESRKAMANARWLDEIGASGECIQQDNRQPHDNPLASFNSILADISNDVEQSIRQRGADPPRDVFVGCFPLASINACLRKVPNGSLVLVNLALMQVIYQTGKVFLHSYDWLGAGVDKEGGTITVGDSDDNLDALGTLANTVGWESSGWSKRHSIVAITAILNADRYHQEISRHRTGSST